MTVYFRSRMLFLRQLSKSSVRIRNGWFFGLTPLKARSDYLSCHYHTRWRHPLAGFGSLRSFKRYCRIHSILLSRAHSRAYSNLFNHKNFKSNSKLLSLFKKWDAFWFFRKLFSLQNLSFPIQKMAIIAGDRQNIQKRKQYSC